MERLASWRASLRARLIDDLHAAHKLWSVRLAAIGTGVMGLLSLVSTEFPGAYAVLPEGLRDKLPSWIAFVLLGVTLLARVAKQGKPNG